MKVFIDMRGVLRETSTGWTLDPSFDENTKKMIWEVDESGKHTSVESVLAAVFPGYIVVEKTMNSWLLEKKTRVDENGVVWYKGNSVAEPFFRHSSGDFIWKFTVYPSPNTFYETVDEVLNEIQKRSGQWSW